MSEIFSPQLIIWKKVWKTFSFGENPSIVSFMRAFQWIGIPRSVIQRFEKGHIGAGVFSLYIWLVLKQGGKKTYLRDASELLGYSAEQLGKFADRLVSEGLITKTKLSEVIQGKRYTYYRFRLTAQSDSFQLTYRDFDFLIKLGTTELAIGVSLMSSHDSVEYQKTSGRLLAKKWNLDHKTVLKTLANLENAGFLKKSLKDRGFELTIAARFVSYRWEMSNGGKSYVAAQ